MKSLKIILLLSWISSTLPAATVLHSVFEIAEGVPHYGGMAAYAVMWNNDKVWPSVLFETSVSGDTTILTANDCYLEFVGMWIAASMNTVIDSSLFSDRDSAFFYNSISGEHGGMPLAIRDGETAYIAVMVKELIEDPYEVYVLGNSVYGWIELSADEGRITLLDSAIDPTGGSMLVGGNSAAIPEPSSAVLLLVGLSAMALRRKRMAAIADGTTKA